MQAALMDNKFFSMKSDDKESKAEESFMVKGRNENKDRKGKKK